MHGEDQEDAVEVLFHSCVVEAEEDHHVEDSIQTGKSLESVSTLDHLKPKLMTQEKNEESGKIVGQFEQGSRKVWIYMEYFCLVIQIISFIAVYIKINNNKFTHLDVHYFFE